MLIKNRQFQTSAEHAYQVICDQIVSGELKPGEKLTRRAMAKLTGVSTIPVIEALHRLENEGLVVSEPHFGSRVIEMDQKTIRSRFALRIAIECQVARILAYHNSEDLISKLMYPAKQLDNTPRTEDAIQTFWDRHYRFHLQMAELTDCPSFVQELKRLNLFDILRRTIEEYQERRGTASPPMHHEKLVIAISKGDPDLAEKVMREHMNFSGLVTENQL